MPFTILIILLVLVLFLLAYMLLRTLLVLRSQAPAAAEEIIEIDTSRAAKHLAAALQIETVSQTPPAPAPEREFKQLHRLFEKNYPHLHASLHRQVIGSGGLLYAWIGTQPDLPAVLLMGHLDVVPADPATLDQWTHPPFSGTVTEEAVWGRGALDCKGQVVAILEAVETLLTLGFSPERTVYLAFGQDEEVGGQQGAQQIAALLQEKGVELYAVLDEGGSVMVDLVPGTEGPIALVGNAEKGHLCLQLTAESKPGHSATPPEETAIGLLARAITRVQPDIMPVRTAAFEEMYADLGSRVNFGMQFLVSNLWLLKGLLSKRLASIPQAAAIVRTTVAPTLINAGVKENILPAQASAVINLRLLPGDSLQSVVERVTRAVNDPRVKISALEDSGWEASPVSDTDTEIYASLGEIIRQVYPEAAVAPFLVLGATDSRYFCALCPQVFRFSPIAMRPEDVGTVHGIDEHITLEMLNKMIVFYTTLLKNWAG